MPPVCVAASSRRDGTHNMWSSPVRGRHPLRRHVIETKAWRHSSGTREVAQVLRQRRRTNGKRGAWL